MTQSLFVRAATGFLLLPLYVLVLVFLPAGTFRYWQAWTFFAVYLVSALAITVYLGIYDPALLERRLKAGPGAEKERTQKIIMGFTMASFCTTLVLSALDHRFGWSYVPASAVICADVLIVISFLAIMPVFRANSYGASTIRLMEGQRVISSGPYAIVRHPMYAAALLMLLAIPVALGSWWGLLMIVPNIAGIAWRLLDEEQFLRRNLRGYTEYMSTVRYRLLPRVW